MRAEALIDLKDIAKRDEVRKQKRLQAVSASKSENDDVGKISNLKRLKLAGGALLGMALIAGVMFLFDLITNVFAIEQVSIKGAFHDEQAHQIRTVLLPHLHRDLLTVDLENARSALLDLAWLKRAKLWREWPNKVLVEVEEYVPVAYWNDGELMSHEGQAFKQTHAIELTKLPSLRGPAGREKEVLKQYKIIQNLLQMNDMSIKDLTLDQRNTWSLRTADDIYIRLGRDNVENRMRRFLTVLTSQANLNSKNIKDVDLRHSNGFAVSMKKIQPAQQGKRST